MTVMQPNGLHANAAPRRPIRWWPAAVILLLAVGAVIWESHSYGVQRQDRNLAATVIGVITLFLLLLWCLFFSRLLWKIRLAMFAGVLGLILLVAALFRFHGVTGDLVPGLPVALGNPILDLARQAAHSGIERPAGTFDGLHQ